MPSFISHAKAFAVLLTSVSHLQGQYLPGSGCQVKWTCVEATTPSPPGVPAQALDVVCISAVAVSKVQGLSPIKCSIAKQNPTDQPTTGLETCGEKRLEEQLGVLGFTSTLNENVKQIIHLLARGTIFLGNENRKNKPCNRSPSSSHRPSSLLPLSGWPDLQSPLARARAPRAHTPSVGPGANMLLGTAYSPRPLGPPKTGSCPPLSSGWTQDGEDCGSPASSLGSHPPRASLSLPSSPAVWAAGSRLPHTQVAPS